MDNILVRVLKDEVSERLASADKLLVESVAKSIRDHTVVYTNDITSAFRENRQINIHFVSDDLPKTLQKGSIITIESIGEADNFDVHLTLKVSIENLKG